MAGSKGTQSLQDSSPADGPVQHQQLPLLLRLNFSLLINCCAASQAAGQQRHTLIMSPSPKTSHARPLCCAGSGSMQASSAGRSTSPAELLSSDTLHPLSHPSKTAPPLLQVSRQRTGLQANPSVLQLTSLLPLTHPRTLLCRL